MVPTAPIRPARSISMASTVLGWRFAAVLFAFVSAPHFAHSEAPQDHSAATGRSGPPAPIVRAAPTPPPCSNPAARAPQQQPHIAQWMAAHRTLSLAEQQNALAAEPGFTRLTPEVQQRMHERLTQLNDMPPEQRQRVIDRTEAMERLTPPQRQEVRGALKELGSLPEDRRRAVARTFRTARDMPEPERQKYLDLPLVRNQFSDAERSTLNNLIQVAPYLPPPAPPAQAPR